MESDTPHAADCDLALHVPRPTTHAPRSTAGRWAAVRESQLALPWLEGPASAPEPLEIQSRRYLGSKSRLLPFLHRIVAARCGRYESFGDLFAGTGVVASSFNRPEVRIVANDHLTSNAVSLSCWLGTTGHDHREAAALVAYLNALPAEEDNYVSEQYGDRYFSTVNARKIGVVRDEIDRLGLSDALRALALTSLLYAMDRVAHTCGHYDAFRRRPPRPQSPFVRLSTPTPTSPAPPWQGSERPPLAPPCQNEEPLSATHAEQTIPPRDSGGGGRRGEPRDRPLRLQLPRVDVESNRLNEVFREDANALARRIEVDLLYLDPPYNSRQYSDTYHVLENVIRNEKQALVGVARKLPGRPSRSRYCGRDAADALKDLVEHARCRWILLSYNNMSDGDKRSNAILGDEQITGILSQRGPVEVHKTAFNSFTAKRELVPGHEERVYVCEVRR